MKDKKKLKVPSEDEGKKMSKEDELKLKAAENLVGWKKALADYQNLEKDMNKRLANVAEFNNNALILELLPIFDNYQTAVKHIPDDQQSASWAIGLEHILKMWENFLNEHQISKINTINQIFDPNLHESVGQIADKNVEDQMVIEEKLAGYKHENQIIRPAKVIINNIK